MILWLMWAQHFREGNGHQQITMLADDFEDVIGGIAPFAQLVVRNIEDSIAGIEIGGFKRWKVRAGVVDTDALA